MSPSSTTLEYNLRGYEYRTYLDIEEDNMKYFHYCFKGGKRIDMPAEFDNYTPYEKIKPAEFAEFVNNLEVFIQG
jgi:hypothetical protein